MRQKLKWIWLARCGTLFLFVTVQRNISQPLNNPSRVIFCLQDVSKENVIKYVWQASVTSRSNLQKAIIYSSIFFEKEKHLLEHVLKEAKGESAIVDKFKWFHHHHFNRNSLHFLQLPGFYFRFFFRVFISGRLYVLSRGITALPDSKRWGVINLSLWKQALRILFGQL